MHKLQPSRLSPRAAKLAPYDNLTKARPTIPDYRTGKIDSAWSGDWLCAWGPPMIPLATARRGAGVNDMDSLLVLSLRLVGKYHTILFFIMMWSRVL